MIKERIIQRGCTRQVNLFERRIVGLLTGEILLLSFERMKMRRNETKENTNGFSRPRGDSPPPPRVPSIPFPLASPLCPSLLRGVRRQTESRIDRVLSTLPGSDLKAECIPSLDKYRYNRWNYR